MLDMVEVVALDLIRKAHSLKQEEPTIADDNYPILPQASEEQDYERTDSPLPQHTNKDKETPFKINLLEMPIDPGSSAKKGGFES